MRRIHLTTLLLGLLLAACASSPRAKFDFDPQTDFSRYRTFAMAAPPSEAPAALPGYSELAGQEMNRDLAAELVAKGLQETEEASADLVVAFKLAGEARSDVRSTPSPSPRGAGRYGDWYGVGWYDNNTHTVNYVVGTLIVDVFDRASQELIWHGWSSVSLYSSKDADSKRSGVIRAVMSGFPPE